MLKSSLNVTIFTHIKDRVPTVKKTIIWSECLLDGTLNGSVEWQTNIESSYNLFKVKKFISAADYIVT